MTGIAKSEGRRSRKGRNADLQAYYDALLARLISAREQSGMTQREVSLRLGMAHSFLNKCESGERAIDVAKLWALANIYGKPVSYFAPDKL